MAGEEQFILTVTENGFGKRTSSYRYRTTGRGGQGVTNIDVTEKNGPVAASFPVDHDDEIMLVSDGGTLIRMPVHDIRIAARDTQGVTLLRTADGERVVSAARLCDLNGSAEEGPEGDGEGEEGAGDDTAPGGEHE